jgi:hypothetical protein
MTWTKLSKLTSAWKQATKFLNGFLVLQDGGYALFQDGSKIIINEKQTDTYSKGVKPTSNWSSVAKP